MVKMLTKKLHSMLTKDLQRSTLVGLPQPSNTMERCELATNYFYLKIYNYWLLYFVNILKAIMLRDASL
jgi:hypothetical protein